MFGPKVKDIKRPKNNGLRLWRAISRISNLFRREPEGRRAKRTQMPPRFVDPDVDIVHHLADNDGKKIRKFQKCERWSLINRFYNKNGLFWDFVGFRILPSFFPGQKIRKFQKCEKWSPINRFHNKSGLFLDFVGFRILPSFFPGQQIRDADQKFMQCN